MAHTPALLQFTAQGIYCAAGDFYIDPVVPVRRAVITHAHSDHARRGSQRYLCVAQCEPLLRHRLGDDISCNTLPYGETLMVDGVQLSFHPAGHVFGSAQVRIEFQGEVWVCTGDYKLEDDGVCAPFEPVQCHTLTSECTFGLPLFHWQPQEELYALVNQWWRSCKERGATAVLYAYSLGKAQRLLRHLDPELGAIYAHSTVFEMTEVIRQQGVHFPKVTPLTSEVSQAELRGAFVFLPPSAVDRRLHATLSTVEYAEASGWMQLRTKRRGAGTGRGFVISDHADWRGLLQTIKATGAETVIATHGYTEPFTRYIREELKINAVEAGEW